MGVDDRKQVASLESVSTADLRTNGGHCMFRRSIFDEIRPGKDLVPDAIPRLIERGEVLGYRCGFWAPMDTVRDWQTVVHNLASGVMPWAQWQSPPAGPDATMPAR